MSYTRPSCAAEKRIFLSSRDFVLFIKFLTTNYQIANRRTVCNCFFYVLAIHRCYLLSNPWWVRKLWHRGNESFDLHYSTTGQSAMNLMTALRCCKMKANYILFQSIVIAWSWEKWLSRMIRSLLCEVIHNGLMEVHSLIDRINHRSCVYKCGIQVLANDCSCCAS